MKNLLTVGLALLCFSFAKAQNSDRIFKPFKLDLALGYASPEGSGSKAGVLFAIEPKYAVMDEFWVGLRIETAVTARGYDAPNGSFSSGNVAASASYVFTGDYYFSNGGFRPFVRLGPGIYTLAHGTFDSYSGTSAVSSTATTKFGGMVRAGFETGHFRLGIEYNLIGNTNENATDDVGNAVILTSKNSYLGIKLGAFILGGRQ